MVAAGITAVGEFHYLHHQQDGTPYADPNAMGHALLEAAREAGIRITLLDTLYLSSGFGKPPHGVQVRYSDGTAQAWADRVEAIDAGPGARVGAALHSVRAVPRDALEHVARTDHDVAARAPVRAGRGERRVPGGVRRHPDPTARRPRPAAADHHARPRHPPGTAPTSPSSARRTPTSTSVPPPSATSATASARVATSPRPAPGSPSARTATPSSTSSRRCAPSSSTSGWPPCGAVTGRRPSCSRAATTTGHASLGWSDAGSDRGRPARGPGHPRPGLAAHGRRGRRRARGGLRRERRRRAPGDRRRPPRAHPRPGAARSGASSTG